MGAVSYVEVSAKDGTSSLGSLNECMGFVICVAVAHKLDILSAFLPGSNEGLAVEKERGKRCSLQ